MGIIINGTLNIDTINGFNIKKEKPFVPTFNFTFDQQWAFAGATVTSISGFTSTPAFTSTSNAFTFNSTGSPIGIITFSFTMTSNGIATDIQSNMYVNEDIIGGVSNQIEFGATLTYPPISVSAGDTVYINTFIGD
jgi:hypothetical protein